MQIYSTEELNDKFGKGSYWMPIRTSNLCHYLAGIEAYDELIDPNAYLQVPNIADFQIRPNGLEIRMMHKFKQYKTGVAFDRIVSISLEDKEQVFEQKEKSVVGRAIVGGLLLGPVGAIVGGMSGLKPATVKAPMPDLILSIQIGDSETNLERVIMFSCKYKAKSGVTSFFKKNLPTKFNVVQVA